MTRKISHSCRHDSSSMRGGTLKCQSKQTPTVVRYFKYRVRETGSGKALSPFHTALLCSDPSNLSWSPRRHFVWKYFRPQACQRTHCVFCRCSPKSKTSFNHFRSLAPPRCQGGPYKFTVSFCAIALASWHQDVSVALKPMPACPCGWRSLCEHPTYSSLLL